MNQSRFDRLLEGQSSTARKVFEYVPINEPWLECDIAKSIHNNTSLRLGLHVVRACLNTMKEAGLIKETQRNRYQRTPVTEKKQLTLKSAPPSAPTAIETTTMPAAKKVAPVTPLDLLGTIATDLVLLSVAYSEQIKAIAGRVEEVALLVEAQRETDNAAMAKVRQLNTLMRDIGGLSL